VAGRANAGLPFATHFGVLRPSRWLACLILSYSGLAAPCYHSTKLFGRRCGCVPAGSLATFMTAAILQAYSAPSASEAFVDFGRRCHRAAVARRLASFFFCTFFAWNPWTLAHASLVMARSRTRCGPAPLAIPYGLMVVWITASLPAYRFCRFMIRSAFWRADDRAQESASS